MSGRAPRCRPRYRRTLPANCQELGVCDLSPDGRPHRTEELAEGPGQVEGAVAGDAGTHASQLLLLSGLVLDTARHVRLGL